MTLRKKTIDNSVKFFQSANSSQGKKSHDHKPKTASIPQKQKKTFTKQKKVFKNISGERFGQLK